VRKAENEICKNLLFCEFVDSTRSQGGGFFGRLRLPQNDGVGFGFFIYGKILAKCKNASAMPSF